MQASQKKTNPHSKSKPKSYTLAELTADLEDVTIQGDAETEIFGVTTIQDAKPGCITFLMNPIYKKYLATTNASAVIIMPGDAEECSVNAIISRDPYFTYAKIAEFFDDRPLLDEGIHPSAIIGENSDIDPTARIAANAVIGKNVTIGKHVQIGANTVVGDGSSIDEHSRLDANVTLYHNIVIGKHVIVSSGAVLGGDGFGIAKHAGVWHKVPQLGRVVLKDYVEVGANTALDRGAIGDTVVEEGTKLDNLIQIGHNVKIGKHSAVAGCVGIAGSATIGDNVLIGGGAGINGHITIGDNILITGMAAITKSINEPGVYATGLGGVVTAKEMKRNSARFHRLDQLMDRIKKLEMTLELIERKDA